MRPGGADRGNEACETTVTGSPGRGDGKKPSNQSAAGDTGSSRIRPETRVRQAARWCHPTQDAKILMTMVDNPFVPKPILITKLEAARRQLATAIELWFLDGDPISIHTLAFAAHEVVHVIFRKNGGTDLLFHSRRIKDEIRGKFNKLLKG